MHDIGPEEEAGVAMKKMTELGIRRLPVIEKGRLMGEDSNKTAFDLISKIYIP
jgi:CBS domain-containing protein